MHKLFFLTALGTISCGYQSGGRAEPDASAHRVGGLQTNGGEQRFGEYPVPSYPHDVAPAPDGTIWFTEQQSGELGNLDPATGQIRLIPLSTGSRPHGVIVGPDGAPWITDGRLNANAIVRVDPVKGDFQVFALPFERRNSNLNTATFDLNGVLWFTGQNGVYGRLDPASGQMEVFDAPRGPGPYGIATTRTGDVYFASLAGNYVGHIDTKTGEATVLEPPTPRQGARRVWPDSQERIWVSEWNVGQLALYDPSDGSWGEWELPNRAAFSCYAVFVDERDQVWATDWGNNALVHFNPATETFEVFPYPSDRAEVRQLLGRPGEVWGAESGVNKLVVFRTKT